MAALHLATLFVVSAGLRAEAGNLSIISGVLQTEDGKRVDALIGATRIRSAPLSRGSSPPTPGLTQHTRVSSKTKDASFSFSGLDAGMYEICATVFSDGYLDPCLWEAHGVLVNLPALQIVKGVTITLKKASTIRVHVDDPSHLMGVSPEGLLIMGVFGPEGRFLPLVRRSENALQRLHSRDSIRP